MTEPKPLPCPFCGGTAIRTFPVATIGGEQWTEACTDCETRGPRQPSREEAIAAWNRRAPWTVTRERAKRALIVALEDADIPLPPDKALRLFAAYTSGHNPFDDGMKSMVEALGGKVEG